MSEKNISVVQEAFKCFSEGDLSGLLNVCAEDIVIDHRGPSRPLNKLCKGVDGVREFWTALFTTQEILEFKSLEFFSNQDRVVSLGHFHFLIIETGSDWASDFAMAFTVKCGAISNWKGYFDMTAESIAYAV